MKVLQKMRQAIYGFSIALVLLPGIASAQWAPVTDPASPLYDSTGLSASSISWTLLILMRWLLYIVGFLGVIAFVTSGIWYLTSTGNDDRIERAKEIMIYAIIGVIVALMGLVIINAVDTWLLGDTATF